MSTFRSIYLLSLCLVPGAVALAQQPTGETTAAAHAETQAAGGPARAVLVELFTSEGCSDCPAADELLRQVNGRRTTDGQMIVGLSEHVTYWNRLGWRDPFSSDASTARQNQYGSRFKLESVYTPQMVVNGREQFVGSDRHALEAALAMEERRQQIFLQIDSTRIGDKSILVTYSASNMPMATSIQLVAVLVDDLDRSNVLRGENSGRALSHVAVARAFVALGPLHPAAQRSVTLPLPPSYLGSAGAGHHLVLFAQDENGAVDGVDSKPLDKQ